MSFSTSVHAPDSQQHVAVIRHSDGKQVAPKALMPNGRVVDISATRKRVCLLFQKSKNKLAVFRMGTSLDGTRVTGNDFAKVVSKTYGADFPPRVPTFHPGACLVCPEVGPPAVEGRMVDVYAPVGTCQVFIDDCTK